MGCGRVGGVGRGGVELVGSKKTMKDIQKHRETLTKQGLEFFSKILLLVLLRETKTTSCKCADVGHQKKENRTRLAVRKTGENILHHADCIEDMFGVYAQISFSFVQSCSFVELLCSFLQIHSFLFASPKLETQSQFRSEVT